MAYVIEKPLQEVPLPYLPEKIVLPKTNETIILDYYKDSDHEGLYCILKEVVDEGQTYPQDSMDKNHFGKFFLSHDVFVVRDSTDGKVVGSFYVKPNFPGRSSHICNGGFLVHSDYRSKGIGRILFQKYLRISKDLGYEGSFFNLVYASNQASLALCRRLGFKEVGIVPKAGKLKELGYVDAFQFYYDLTTLNQITN